MRTTTPVGLPGSSYGSPRRREATIVERRKPTRLCCRSMLDRPPDFGRTAADYARYRSGFPSELLDRLAAKGIARPGARVVDLGTGTGSLARLFARHRCVVTGVDIAAPLLEEARLLDREAGLQIDYINAPAEATGLPEAAFDVVSAGQCWHWFDRPAAAHEVARLLTEGGFVAIAHFDWLAFGDNVVEATQEIILRYTPPGSTAHGPWPFSHGTGVYPQWLVDLQSAGFTEIETFSFDIQVRYAHAAWVGRIRASAPIAATLDEARVRSCSGELTAMLTDRFPEDPLSVPHRVWAVTARR
jgi:SAM-dependent methyltransferase